MIGLMLEMVNAEESLPARSIMGGEEPTLSKLINNALLGNFNANPQDSTIFADAVEEYQVIHSYQNSHSHLSTLINNALLGNFNANPQDSVSTDHVKEQFITIKEDGFNDNMIFEEPKKNSEVQATTVPFILPVPFP
jgi:hypothetical protein